MPLDYTPVKTQSSYEVEVLVEDMKAILAAERTSWKEKSLFQKLDSIPGVTDTDYEGHFGPFVYFTIEAEKDTPAKHRRIASTIKVHIKRCLKRLE